MDSQLAHCRCQSRCKRQATNGKGAVGHNGGHWLIGRPVGRHEPEPYGVYIDARMHRNVSRSTEDLPFASVPHTCDRVDTSLKPRYIIEATRLGAVASWTCMAPLY